MGNQTGLYTRYVILLTLNSGNKLTEKLIKEHVDFLKKLESKNKLVLCGPFSDYNGGMIIIKAKSYKEAQEIAESDPFIISQAESYEIRTWELSCKENNHMGMG
ncbi:hypothetical protein H1D32_22965 [Anaerobacillus sp. CMMVII]|uniref:YciI family protein n=1 Tax=Anaerobacillus sp. CMMVII TaxID=2755588 RepID=UPI0021B7CD42|nr:YciI family protein [Anaerobacillus sp. CMMVII]MCT8140305.1 hypothetical protein [Anaerobacillus sp. CMMVII]